MTKTADANETGKPDDDAHRGPASERSQKPEIAPPPETPSHSACSTRSCSTPAAIRSLSSAPTAPKEVTPSVPVTTPTENPEPSKVFDEAHE